MYPWTDSDVLLVLQQTPDLDCLSISSWTDIPDASFLQHLPRYCAHLTSLKLYHTHITQHTVDALGHYGPQLTELTLGECRHLGPDTFSVLSKTCRLTALTIELSDLGDPVSDKVVQDLTSGNGFGDLVQLTLGSRTLDSDFIDDLLFSSAAAAASGKGWPHLDKLIIYKYRPLDGSSRLVPFLQSHPGLKELSLVLGRYDDTLLHALATLQPPPPHLTHLKLDFARNISAGAVRHLVQQWPMLRSVTLSDCDMTPAMFPEADKESHYETLTDVTVEYLDEDAIHKIRQGGYVSTSDTSNNSKKKRSIWKRLFNR
ncbi:hypothetical protein BCR42DRAFT_426463 [Absidia repens]|uniref:F-box domain-containing protein n=1 Tax=Absidia repens TaxID=90262 RepID=A0A1X2I176_9FUNG|nr:hypothetical protein BCR42DRAFT_426463 [Absidia repens]